MLAPHVRRKDIVTPAIACYKHRSHNSAYNKWKTVKIKDAVLVLLKLCRILLHSKTDAAWCNQKPLINRRSGVEQNYMQHSNQSYYAYITQNFRLDGLLLNS